MRGARRSFPFLATTALLLAAGCSGKSSTNAQTKELTPAQAASEAAKAASGPWRKPQIAGCAIEAYSFDKDPNGLAVRSKPSGESKIVGRLYSLVDVAPVEDPLPSDPMIGPQFTIIAVQGDWLRIADISPTTEGFDKASRMRREIANFQGIGWVNQAKVAVDTGYWDKAFDRPYFDGGNWHAIDDDAGINLYPWHDMPFGRETILACEMQWVKLRYDRIATKIPEGTSPNPDNVRFFDKAERANLSPVTGWMKSDGNAGRTGQCTPVDFDCSLRRAHEWD